MARIEAPVPISSPKRLKYEANCNGKREDLFFRLLCLSGAAFYVAALTDNEPMGIASTAVVCASAFASLASGEVAYRKSIRCIEASRGTVDTGSISDAHIFTRRNHYRNPSTSASA